MTIKRIPGCLGTNIYGYTLPLNRVLRLLGILSLKKAKRAAFEAIDKLKVFMILE